MHTSTDYSAPITCHIQSNRLIKNSNKNQKQNNFEQKIKKDNS